jgi:hypothetical protein
MLSLPEVQAGQLAGAEHTIHAAAAAAAAAAANVAAALCSLSRVGS